MEKLFKSALIMALGLIIISDLVTSLLGFVLFLATLVPPPMWPLTAFFSALLASEVTTDIAFIKGWALTRRWPNVVGVIFRLGWVLFFSGMLYVGPPPGVLAEYPTACMVFTIIFWWLLAFNGFMTLFHAALISGRVRDSINEETELQQPKEEYN